MRKMLTSAWILAVALTGALVLAGCQEARPTVEAPLPPPVVVTVTDSLSHCTVALPTGARETSDLFIERTAPAEVTLGQVFAVDIVVTNLTGHAINAVDITDHGGTTFNLDSSTPPVTTLDNSGCYHWALGTLAPHETRTIKVSGTATGLGVLRNCASGTYEQKTCCVGINVVQPKLTLTAEAPPEVLRCDPIPVRYVVTNTGTGTAHHVVIKNDLPANALTSDGRKAFIADVGELPAGSRRAFDGVLKATDVGTINNSSMATADGNLAANAVTCTVVKAPVLKITKTAPAMIYLGRPISYDITVTNTGDGDARQATLVDNIPPGARLVSATNNATSNAAGAITWNLGTLKPGATVRANVVVQADAIGDLQNTAVARAFCAEAVSAEAKTAVRGIPAILLEMVDLTDPIEVGNVETYVITITNQGSATDTNVVVKGILEDTMGYDSCGGATAGTFDGVSTVTFAPLPALAPKAKAVWTVKVKALKPGDVRFKTTLTSDQLTRPVEKTESTNFYR